MEHGAGVSYPGGGGGGEKNALPVQEPDRETQEG